MLELIFEKKLYKILYIQFSWKFYSKNIHFTRSYTFLNIFPVKLLIILIKQTKEL